MELRGRCRLGKGEPYLGFRREYSRSCSNRRTSFANSYDYADTNPNCYDESGGVLTDPITDIAGSKSDLQGALAAVIGRYSEYSSNFNFGADGNLLPAGAGVARNFASEEYEMYAQDTWHVRRDLTLTFGLHYNLDRPVYETNGLEVSLPPASPQSLTGGLLPQRRAFRTTS